MKHTITILSALVLTACTQPDDSKRVLESAGYTNVQTGGYDFFNCSEDDTFKTRFTATGPNGKQVAGVVCAGLFFKGSTIRID
jgi:hypothetical protein